MNRLLQRCFEDHYFETNDYISISEQVKNDIHTRSNGPLINNMYTDLIINYILDVKCHMHSKSKRMDLLRLYKKCGPASRSFIVWIKDMYIPELKKEQDTIRSDLLEQTKQYEELFHIDSDYPIYTRVLSTYHKTIVRLKQIKYILYQAERIVIKESEST